MSKLIYIFKFNSRLLIISFLILLMSLVVNCYQFFYNENSFEPYNSLVMSSAFVQVGIFIFMIYGVLTAKSFKRKENYASGNIITSWFINSLFVLVLSLGYNLLFLLVVIIPFLHLNIQMNLLDIIQFVLIYWELPFLISGIIGLTLYMIFNHKFTYVLLVLLAIILGPLGHGLVTENIYQKISLFYHDPTFPFHPLYGLPLEKFSILKRLSILGISMTILPLYSITTKRILNRKVIILSLSVLIILIAYNNIFLISKQVIINYGEEGESTLTKEPKYYAGKIRQDTFLSMPIGKIEGQITNNSQKINADLTLTLTENVLNSNYSFSLYHDLDIDLIEDTKGNPLDFSRDGDIVTVIDEVTTSKINISYNGKSSPLYPANSQSVFLPAYFPWLPSSSVDQAFINVTDGVIHRTSLQPLDKIEYDLQVELNTKKEVYSNVKNSNGKYTGFTKGITILSNDFKEVYKQKTKYILPVSWINIQKDLTVIEREVTSFLDFINSTFDKNHEVPEDIILFPITGRNDFLIEEDVWYLDNHIIINYPFYFTMKEGVITDPTRIEELIVGMASAFTWKSDSFEWNEPDMMELFNAFLAELYFKKNDLKSNYFEMTIDRINLSDSSLSTVANKIKSKIKSDPKDLLLMEKVLIEWYRFAKSQNGNFTEKDLNEVLEAIK